VYFGFDGPRNAGSVAVGVEYVDVPGVEEADEVVDGSETREAVARTALDEEGKRLCEGTSGAEHIAAAADTVVADATIKVGLGDGGGDCCTSLMVEIACLYP
jgi:hypothetical protein